MFVRYFVEIEADYERVRVALLDAPAEIIGGPARAADARSRRLLAEVGFPVADRRLDKTVELEIGDPATLPTKTLLPISWQAVGPRGLFPVMEGDVELAPLGAHRTQFALSARYRPPLGPVGRVVDRALLHRVAEATVKDFLDRAAATLEARVRGPATGGAAATDDGVLAGDTEPTPHGN